MDDQLNETDETPKSFDVSSEIEGLEDGASLTAVEAPDFDDEEDELDAPTSRSWLPLVLVGLAMLVVGALLGYFGRGEFGPEAQAAKATRAAEAVAAQTQAAASADMMNYLIENTRHFKGDENAPVTIIEFSDFQCPYCGTFANEAGRQIDETYIQNGKVRFGYWNFTFLGEESEWAAQAAECAADQGKYWEYHDALFAAQSGENQNAFSKDNLKSMASELGLDSATFDQCLESGKHVELIQADTGLAQQIGVQSTPSFLVNGTPLIGAQPFSAFENLIESFLK